MSANNNAGHNTRSGNVVSNSPVGNTGAAGNVTASAVQQQAIGHPSLAMPVLGLEALASSSAVDKFLTNFAAYKVLHPEAKLAVAVVPKVVTRLRRLHRTKFDAVCPEAAGFLNLEDHKVSELLRKSFAVPSLEAAVKRLSHFRFNWDSKKSTMAGFTAVASSFLDELDRCEDSGVTLSVKVVKNCLISCVYPEAVKEKIQRRFGEEEARINEPGEWIPFLLRILENWVESAETLRDIETSDSDRPGKRSRSPEKSNAMNTQVEDKSRNARKRQRDDERAAAYRKKSKEASGGKICFGCGHPGHGRDRCPNRNSKGFVKAPGRISKPISL
jgi:hypothetical protein